jgi:hypothetical protein
MWARSWRQFLSFAPNVVAALSTDIIFEKFNIDDRFQAIWKETMVIEPWCLTIEERVEDKDTLLV